MNLLFLKKQLCLVLLRSLFPDGSLCDRELLFRIIIGPPIIYIYNVNHTAKSRSVSGLHKTPDLVLYGFSQNKEVLGFTVIPNSETSLPARLDS